MAEKFLGKGYWTGSNYMGWVPEKNTYQKFENEEQYRETIIFPQIDSEEDEEDL